MYLFKHSPVMKCWEESLTGFSTYIHGITLPSNNHYGSVLL